MCVWGTIGWYMDLVAAFENGSVFWYLGDSPVASSAGVVDLKAENGTNVANNNAVQLPSWVEVVKQFFRFFLLNYQLVPVSL